MNPRLALGFSLGLNLLLLAGWVALPPRSGARRPAPTPERPILRITPPPKPVVVEVAAPSPPTPAPIPFHWSQVATSNWQQLKTNLAAVGCPPATIADILHSEINDHFAQRRQALSQAVQGRFWEILARSTTNSMADAIETMSQPYEDLMEERNQALKGLGESSAPEAEARLEDQRTGWSRTWAWLPAAKQEAVMAVEEKYYRLLQELDQQIRQRADGKATPEDKARRQELLREAQQARRDLLSPAEWEEHQLRASGASHWAARLAGFEPTEEEWRQVTRAGMARSETQDKLAKETKDKKLLQAQRQEAQLQYEAQVRDILGPERYVEYQRAQHPDYQQVRKVVRRYGLPSELAATVDDLRQTAQQSARQLRENTGLEASARRAALEAIQRETEQTLRQTLGEPAFETYRRYGGAWMGEMAGGLK